MAVCLDLDGTLLEGTSMRECVRLSCVELAARRPELHSAQLVEANAREWPPYWQEIEEAWFAGQLSGQALRSEAWRRTLAACGCTSEAVIELAVEVQTGIETDSYRLFDDVAGLLDLLSANSVPTALVTNGASDAQRLKLRLLGIEERFDSVVISDEVGYAKPAKEIFTHALSTIGAEAETSWHIGDNLVADIGGARSAGLTSVWVNRPSMTRDPSHPEPHLEVNSLSELSTFFVGA